MIKKNRPVYLCGFMGCGKSTIGRQLAKRLGREFIDLDSYIEEREGMKISRIFAEKGEPYFRQKETEALSDIPQSVGVIATGGGALLSRENADIARDLGTVVYIEVPFETCYERIKGDKSRPIAYNSTEEELHERYDQRHILYSEHSDITVDGSGTPLQIVAEILK
jgi:shikimate kinase